MEYTDVYNYNFNGGFIFRNQEEFKMILAEALTFAAILSALLVLLLHLIVMISGVQDPSELRNDK